MAIDIFSAAHSEEEEDYIDLEVISYSIFHCKFIIPPSNQQHQPSNREFEFMSSVSLEREQPSTSPADELFYKGKLLPLHFPPRVQMVEKLLESPNKLNNYMDTCEEFYSTPLATSPSSTPDAFRSTPFQSWSLEGDEVNSENPKKYWGKKMKLIKQSLLGPKMKTPQAYLRSFLGRYSCSNESSCANNINQASTIKALKEPKSSHTNGRLPNISHNQPSSSDTMKDQHHCKRSLSGLSKRLSTSKTSITYSPFSWSSSSSDSPLASCDHSNGCNQLRFPMRSNSRSSEVESPIQGAIKHCKQSQHAGKRVAVFPESGAQRVPSYCSSPFFTFVS
ncbi:hypothetical protein SAY87_006146 [Trapa incisa]|uniref:Membrane-associated kinase regulator 4 n=1 Tax=Trapa incisa TaxID=236973 RepID=A0AAN7Q8A6_9MYRT|nr:hypothetical protein SAY87_006146 [Trapa incisa]